MFQTAPFVLSGGEVKLLFINPFVRSNNSGTLRMPHLTCSHLVFIACTQDLHGAGGPRAGSVVPSLGTFHSRDEKHVPASSSALSSLHKPRTATKRYS